MRMLYISDIPVGCLVSNSLSESISFIRTSETTERGAIKQLPTLHAYSIPFECVYTVDGAIVTYEDLQSWGRDRLRLEWSIIDTDLNQGDAGQAFIENLELIASSTDFIKFTGTLTGYGAIVASDLIYYVWAQSPTTFVDNVNKYVLVAD